MRRNALLVVALALAALFATAALAWGASPAPPFDNAECLSCHDVATGSTPDKRVDFGVPNVDYGACNKCHWTLLNQTGTFGFNHLHVELAYRCVACHATTFNGNPAWAGQYLAPTGGRFASAASTSTAPEQIHQIHSKASWPAYPNAGTFVYGGTPYCDNCHAAAACSACHTGTPTGHRDHALPRASTETSFAPVTRTVGGGSTDIIGTKKQDTVSTVPITCVAAACHKLDASAAPVTAPVCGSCHLVQTGTHGYDEVQHSAEVTFTVDGGGKACGVCHSTDLYGEHQRTSSASALGGCGACHPLPRTTFTSWNKTCQQAGCHAAGSQTEPHAAIASQHATSTAPEALACYDCHQGDLAAVHTEATSTVDPTRTSCLVCHSAASVPSTNNCTTCHFTYDAHPYPATPHLSTSALANCGGSGCHSTRDLLGAHQEKNPAYGCADCHGSARSEVRSAIAAGLTGCSDCHKGVSESQAHYAQHEARPPLIGGAPDFAPNYAFYTGSAAGGLFTSDCAGCHASNLADAHVGGAGRAPQFDSTGAPLTCDTCHKSTDPRVIAAIAAGPATGETKCEACHVDPLTGGAGVHAPIGRTHQSTFKTDPEVKCTPCHNANVVEQHNGGRAWPDANGKQLVGCDVCHRNFAGARGQQVQAAIQPLNDTRCTACHAASHPDFSSHEATTSASLACGGCHAKGQSVIDVKAIHAGSIAGACAVCHDNSARVADIRTESAECGSCHTSQGTDYHRDFSPAHVAPSSDACTACHETNDVVTVHTSTLPGDDCALCHDNAARVPTLPATTACTNCHSDKSPPDAAHYTGTEATHTAADATENGFACSTCHKLEMNPEHAKATSGSVACATCHESKVDTITAPWDKSCSACHATKHDGIAAAHDATGIGNADTCAGAQCHPVADVRAIHANSIPGNAATAGDASCGTTECHTSNASVPSKKSCDSPGCHSGTKPHRHELDAAGSTYVSDVSGGCLGAGAGCHDTSSSESYQPYHPAGGCLAGACHTATNHNDTRYDDPNTCQSCHGVGVLYQGAPNVAGLLGSSPAGHYRDALHKPDVNNAAMRGGSGGLVIGYCRDCHNPTSATDPEGLYIQHSEVAAWPDKTRLCTECHGDSAAVSAVVKSSWPTGLCSECHSAEVLPGAAQHTTDTAPPVTATEKQGAGSCVSAGCHSSLDLHALHKGSESTPADSTLRTRGCAISGCHYFGSQAARPTKKSCGAGGACHTTQPHDPSAHNASTSGECLDCHERAGTAADVREVKTSAGASAHAGCQTCHNSGANLGGSKRAECIECHNGANVGSHAYTPPATTHYSETTHTASSMTRQVSAGGTASAACSACHSTALYAAHAVPTPNYGNGLSCVECHTDTLSYGKAEVASSWSTDSCDDCHKLGASAVMHSASLAPSVAATGTTSCASTGTGCHATGDLHELHRNQLGGCSLAGCHEVEDLKPSKKSCGAEAACHTTYNESNHYTEAPTHTADVSTSYVYAGKDNPCSTCHSAALKVAHVSLPESTCLNCHNSTDPDSAAVIKGASGWNKSCLACHTVYHGEIATVHAGVTPADATCLGADCHLNNSTDLIGVHAGKANSCVLSGCHTTASKDGRPATKTCLTCHPGKSDTHGDHPFTTTSDFDASAQEGCTNSGAGCHGSDPVREARKYHPTCAGCHASASYSGYRTRAGNFECVNCHNGNYANAPDVVALDGSVPNGHYNETTHTATSMTRVVNAGGTASASCSTCHATSLYSAHGSMSSSAYGTSLSCYECHNDAGSNGNAQVAANWAADRCDDCHSAGSAVMHSATTAAAVTASTTAGCTTGTGCHATELHALHKNGASCALAGCHDAKNAQPSKKSCGAGGTCHTTLTGDHEPQHDTAGAVDSGCYGCHYQYLTKEHASLGYTCSTCHSSTNASVQAAIASSTRNCDACHPAVNGRDRHAGQKTSEFTPGNSSIHRAYSELPGMRSSFKVGSLTYTWTLPATSNFLKTGWATDSMVKCNSCHTYSGTNGPHGASVAINVDPAFPGDYSTAALGTSGISPTTTICAKCHTNFRGMNNVHSAGDHDNERCVVCHTKVPHGWRLPRMLAYTTDSAPYASTGLVKIVLRNRTPNSWQEGGDCQSSCGEHDGTVSPVWPSQLNVVAIGTVNGVVRDSSGAPVSGALVQVAGDGSATSSADGRYTVTGVPAGTVTITASKAGYITQTSTTTMLSGGTGTLDFTLLPETVNQALGKTVASSSTYSSSYPAAGAVDGASNTYWRSSSSATQWLSVDLGATYNVSKTVARWNGSYYARAYRIEVSTNNSTWTQVFSTSSGGSGTQTQTFSPAKARYVRIYCTTANSSSGYQLQEFEVHGALAPNGTLSGVVTSASGVTLGGVTVTSSDGQVDITDAGSYVLSLPEGTYSVTYSEPRYVAQTKTVTVTSGQTTTQNVALAPASINYALNSAATASSQSSSSYGAAMAVDGKSSTYWRSASTGSQWVRLDLGVSRSISRVAVNWPGTYYARAYRIESSPDGVNWTTRATVSSNSSSGVKTHTFTAASARYWRVFCTSAASSNYRINELEVWNF